jgi:hypothetical protein
MEIDHADRQMSSEWKLKTPHNVAVISLCTKSKWQ